MGKGTKFAVLIGMGCSSSGSRAPRRRSRNRYTSAFFPHPCFYLILVQYVGFVAILAFMAFFTRLHGRVEDEEGFLRSLKEVKP